MWNYYLGENILRLHFGRNLIAVLKNFHLHYMITVLAEVRNY